MYTIFAKRKFLSLKFAFVITSSVCSGNCWICNNAPEQNLYSPPSPYLFERNNSVSRFNSKPDSDCITMWAAARPCHLKVEENRNIR